MARTVVELCPTCDDLVARTDADAALPPHIDVRLGGWCAGGRPPTLRMRLRRVFSRWTPRLRL